MRRVMLGVVSVLFALSQAVTLSQSDAPPTVAIDITNADIEATLNSPDGGIDRQIRVVDIGKYNLAVGVVHRGPTEDSDSVTGIIHSQVAETYVIRSGSGTLVTGGTLTDSREIPADSPVVRILNGPTAFGTNQGGHRRKVEPGDVIIIPPGVFHGWTEIEDHVTYLSVRPDPDHVLQAGYVNPAVQE